MKEHLIHFFPFLNKEFRKLEESEIRSEEVFKELFPNESIDISKLRAVYMFQQSDDNTINFVIEHKVTSEIIEKKPFKAYVSETDLKEIAPNYKPKRNAKV